jgi:hypothetical protein
VRRLVTEARLLSPVRSYPRTIIWPDVNFSDACQWDVEMDFIVRDPWREGAAIILSPSLLDDVGALQQGDVFISVLQIAPGDFRELIH